MNFMTTIMRQRGFPKSLCSKRIVRTIVTTPDLLQFRDINSVPGFLSRSAYMVSWTQYQSMILEKLNKLVSGSGMERKNVKDISIHYARDPNRASTFNYASMAHNNHFFFESLSKEDTNPEDMAPKLKTQLIRSFGSLNTLNMEMLKTANAIFGPGFVWLVKDFDNNYSILATYLAGSPYPNAHFRKQRINSQNKDEGSNTIGNNSSSTIMADRMREKIEGPAVNQVGEFGTNSKTPIQTVGSPASLTPILCINVWDHVYLPDYGFRPEIAGGKIRYTENWWRKIDWRIVSNRAFGKESAGFVR